MQQNHIKQLGQIFEENERFILTSHANPDGDAIGSEFAIYHFLTERGKSVDIINVDETPDTLFFLENDYKIQLFNRNQHASMFANADVVIILDISDWKRLQGIGELIHEMKYRSVCIDHHLVDEAFANEDFIYPKSSSTGEIIYELLTGLQTNISTKVAEALLTAIMADTGCFRFSNTSPKVFEIASKLQKLGADRQKIYGNMFETDSLPRIRLLARVLNKLNIDFNGKLAWMEITQKMLKEVGATLKDTEGFSDFPRRIKTVEVSLLFMELPDGKVKISFRSKGNIAVNELAKDFTGGGHAYAAGAAMDGRLRDVREDVLFRAQYLFE